VVARDLGMLGAEELTILETRLAREQQMLETARSTSIAPDVAAPVLAAAGERPLAHGLRIAEVAKRPGVSLAALFEAAALPIADKDAALTAELELKYAGYFDRERAQAERLQKLRGFELPNDLPYAELRSLSMEARQKLGIVRPRTLAQAASVPGVNASDLQNLVIEVERRRRSMAAI